MKTATIGACATLIAVACVSEAVSAPTALYNKTISVSFTLSFPPDAVGDRGGRPQPKLIQRTIYISSKGRIFSQRDERAGNLGNAAQRAPEETAHSFRFEADRLIGVRVGVSGASQMIISFDPAFQRCTATVQVGREPGKASKWVGLNGETYSWTGSATVSTPTCSIREGNSFAQ
jgi:hypothetical protein